MTHVALVFPLNDILKQILGTELFYKFQTKVRKSGRYLDMSIRQAVVDYIAKKENS